MTTHRIELNREMVLLQERIAEIGGIERPSLVLHEYARAFTLDLFNEGVTPLEEIEPPSWLERTTGEIGEFKTRYPALVSLFTSQPLQDEFSNWLRIRNSVYKEFLPHLRSIDDQLLPEQEGRITRAFLREKPFYDLVKYRLPKKGAPIIDLYQGPIDVTHTPERVLNGVRGILPRRNLKPECWGLLDSDGKEIDRSLGGFNCRILDDDDESAIATSVFCTTYGLPKGHISFQVYTAFELMISAERADAKAQSIAEQLQRM